ncbi:MAG: HAMP domain-containing sensor histidine kinase [Pseudomonadota bacterium]
MSSTSLAQVLRSRTFRRGAIYALPVLLSLAVVVLGLGVNQLREAQLDQREQIEERLSELAEQLREDGLTQVIDDYSEEFGPLWPLAEAGYLIEEEEVLLLVLQAGTPVLGFAELKVPAGWHHQPLAVAGELGAVETYELLARRVDLGESLAIVGALPPTLAQLRAREALRNLALLLGVFALATLSAVWVTTRYALARVSALSGAIVEMASGDLQARVSVSPASDEYDAVAAQINRMLAQIQRLMRNLEEVSVGAAHDLKTPLTRLDQRLQSIAQEVSDPARVGAHVDAARQHVQTLLTTFNALLRLGEIESGRLRATFDRLSLSELVQDVAETFEPVFSEQGRALEISVVPNLEVVGDRDLIAQLLSNLLENMLEHTAAPCGGWVRLQPHSDGALLQVGDHGPGIPPEEHNRVFERFYRVDKSRSKPGNGLGLSLVASIASVHQASYVLHRAQPGCVIDLTFPAA